jgi:hypothetical protein
MMAHVFGDESADESKTRVFSLSGLIANDSEWQVLKDAWLERTGGVVFHASECESDHGEFAKNDHAGNLKLYADLTQIIVNSGIGGFAVALDLAAWLEYFPGVPTDVGYYKCFSEVIKHFLYGPYRDSFPIEFTFDHRQESEYNAGLLYSHMVNLPEWKEKNVFLNAKVNFDSRKDVRIQAADLVAREAMKHLDNIVGPKQRPIRRSMEALARANSRIKFDILTREYCRDARDKWPELQERAGINIEQYKAWLASHKLLDNWANRFRFVAWLDAQDAAAPSG